MSAMQSEVFEALRATDIPEEKALKASVALYKRDDDVAKLDTKVTVIQWMTGFMLAFQVAIILKLFLH